VFGGTHWPLLLAPILRGSGLFRLSHFVPMGQRHLLIVGYLLKRPAERFAHVLLVHRNRFLLRLRSVGSHHATVIEFVQMQTHPLSPPGPRVTARRGADRRASYRISKPASRQ